MASFIPTSFFNDVFKGNIDCDTDSFKRGLLSAVPAIETGKDSWAKRSDVTNELTTANGYTQGGTALTATVPAKDTTNNQQDVQWGQTQWTASGTLTAAGSFVYKARGGAASADELCFVNDFGGNVSATGGTFTCQQDVTRIQN